MKIVMLLVSWLALAFSAAAQSETPVVQKLDPALQQQVQFLNPEYLVFLPAGNTNEKVPLVIFLHGAGGVGGRHPAGPGQKHANQDLEWHPEF